MFEITLGGVKVPPALKGSWEALSYPFAAGIEGMSMVAVEQYIYTFGGNISGGQSNELWRYDTIDNTWLKLANGLGACRNTTVGVANNKIYYFAGVVAGSYVRTTRCYDIVTNTWSTKATQYPEQYVTDSATITTQDNKILIYGGKPLANSLVSTWLYDPVADTYTYQASRNPGIAGDASFTLDGVNVISAMGQDSTNAPTNQVRNYNINTKLWTVGDPQTTPISVNGIQAAVVNGVAYAFGGSNWANVMYGYDGDEFKWVKVIQAGIIPVGRIGHGWVTVGGSIYLLGGRATSGSYAQFLKFTPPEE